MSHGLTFANVLNANAAANWGRGLSYTAGPERTKTIKEEQTLHKYARCNIVCVNFYVILCTAISNVIDFSLAL